jgi:hypothetical protein
MKRILCALACILSISLVSTTVSAGEEVEERNRYGVGISLFEEFLSYAGISFVSDLTGDVNIYFPLRVGGEFKIEPEFGVMFLSSDYEYDGVTHNNSERIIRIGLGLGPIIQRGKLDMYYGLRFGLSFRSIKDFQRIIYSPEGTEEEISKTDWYLAPAFGSEYFFSPHFSVGGEVRVEFTSYGEWDDSSSRSNLYTIQNRNLFFIRWYF